MEIVVGALIGLVIAMTGLGAGILTTPFLILFFGLPPAACVGTALVFSTAVKLFATFFYVRRRQVDLRILGYMLAGGVPGAIAGALVLSRLQSPKLTAVVLALVGVTVVFSSLLTLFRPPATKGSVSRPRRLSWLAFPIGVQVGFSSSGAGALGTVMLFRMAPLTPAAVVGTDLAFGLALSGAGGLMHALAGNWLPSTLGKMMLGGLLGVPLGARLAQAWPSARLRLAVLVWAACMGAWLTHKGLTQFAW